MNERVELLKEVHRSVFKTAFQQDRLRRLPRWRRPLAVLGLSYRATVYQWIEAPWGWLICRIFFPELVHPRCSTRVAMGTAKTWQFKLAETLLFSPVHYILHPLGFRHAIRRFIRKIREKIRLIGLTTEKAKLADWRRRMERGGPLPRPHGDPRAAYAFFRQMVEELPNGMFEETTESGPVWFNGDWAVGLFNSKGELQGYLYHTDGQGLMRFKTEMDAAESGVLFMARLQEVRQAELDRIQQEEKDLI